MRPNRKQHKARSAFALSAILDCKGGPMRDRRQRRPKDAGRGWRKEHGL